MPEEITIYQILYGVFTIAGVYTSVKVAIASMHADIKNHAHRLDSQAKDIDKAHERIDKHLVDWHKD